MIEGLPGNINVGMSKVVMPGYLELKEVCHWSRRVSGFPEISKEDQVALLKGCYMDICIFRLAWRSAKNKVCLFVLSNTFSFSDLAVSTGDNRTLIALLKAKTNLN